MEGPVWLGGHPSFEYDLEEYSAALLAEAMARSGLSDEEFTTRLADLADKDLRTDHLREWLQGTAIPPGRTLVAGLVLSARADEERSANAPPGYSTLQAVNRREFLREAGRRLTMAIAAIGPPTVSLDPQTLRTLDGAAFAALRRRTRTYARESSGLPFWCVAPNVRAHLALLHEVLLARPSHLDERELRLAVAEAAVLMGWLSYFREHRVDTQAYWTLADELSQEAGDGPLRAYALTSLASLYSGPSQGRQGGDPRLAIGVLDEAARQLGSSSSPYLRAYTWSRRAEEHAASRHAKAARADLDRAHKAVQEARELDDGFFSDWSAARLAGYQGNCAVLLGRPREAITVLETALVETPPDLVPQRAGVLADLGAAYAHPKVQQLDQSCALLSQSLDTASRTAALERVQRVVGIRERYLTRWRAEPEVRRLDERIAEVVANAPA